LISLPSPISSVRRSGALAPELALDGFDVRRHRRRRACLTDAELHDDFLLNVRGDVGVLQEEVAGVLLALPQLVAVVGVPGARLLHDALVDAVVDEAAFA